MEEHNMQLDENSQTQITNMFTSARNEHDFFLKWNDLKPVHFSLFQQNKTNTNRKRASC